ncbi:ATP-grasp fold amidoligase family protein [Brachyspira pilosicoli]|uniref:ATP-grasp fold amidoligase family protein n=1 Tax=Brachyspira pilosicoli TaxID=52584 RepID=UPI0015E15A27|nr:ATP-grasp fold amidoligase family protein [Brachyspira pilosicoli]
MTKEENMKFREELIKKQFKNSLGYDLNLDNPQTFNEKIQWLKLYNHDPLITKCADKYLAREYIKEKIGEEYLIPLLGVWDKAEDINFDSLPNQFVLKVNWGWGQNIIVKDKTKLNIEEVKNKLNNWLEPLSNHYYHNFEWGYKNIPSKIICEKYIEQLDGQVYDYKVFCFYGDPKYIQLDMDRFIEHKRCIYDINWEKMDIIYAHDVYNKYIDKPKYLNNIIDISKKLSSIFLFVRIDFFVIENNIFVGELTFSPENGNGKFIPEEWDYKWGQLLELPKEKKIEYDVLDRDALIQQAVLLEPISEKYKELGYVLKYKDNLILEKDAIIEEYEKIINKNIDENLNNIKLNSNWFNFLTLFAISNNDEYVRIILFGIKFTFRVNENIINKVAWWIPVKKWRESFRAKFKIRPDQTRPDQTRPDSNM